MTLAGQAPAGQGVQYTPWTPKVVGDYKGRDVYDVIDTRGYALCGTFFKDEAYLVAAAPDLLEALRKLVELADTQPFAAIGHLVEHVVPEVRAALSRATGSQP